MNKKDFKKKYIQLWQAYLKCNIDKIKTVQTVKNEASVKINTLKEELNETRKKYFVTNYGNAKLFLDGIELGGNKISFDGSYSIEPMVEKRSVVVGYYKNGKPRTKTMPFAFVVISSGNGLHFSIQAGNTITEARTLAQVIKTQISEGKPLKEKLDQDCLKLEKQISKLEKERTNQIQKLNQEYVIKKNESKKELDEFLAQGSSEELGFLFRTSRIVLLAILSLVGICTICLAVTGYTHLVRTLVQLNYNYEIEAPDSVEFDCNMRFDENKHVFLCDSKNYFGRVSMTDESSLSIGGEWHTPDGNGNFERYVPELMIPATSWAVEKPDFDQILEKVNYYYDMIVIRNDYLWSGMKQKDVVVTWNFDEDDLKLMNETWEKWSLEQEQRAKERLEAEKKAAEEKRIKAEQEERERAEKEAREKAEQEAREKAEAEAKATEEARQKAASSSTSSSNSNSSSSSGSSSSSNSGSSSGSSGGGYPSSDTDIEGYCKDGTKVRGNPHARGKANVCYGHQGWVGN